MNKPRIPIVGEMLFSEDDKVSTTDRINKVTDALFTNHTGAVFYGEGLHGSSMFNDDTYKPVYSIFGKPCILLQHIMVNKSHDSENDFTHMFENQIFCREISQVNVPAGFNQWKSLLTNNTHVLYKFLCDGRIYFHWTHPEYKIIPLTHQQTDRVRVYFREIVLLGRQG